MYRLLGQRNGRYTVLHGTQFATMERLARQLETKHGFDVVIEDLSIPVVPRKMTAEYLERQFNVFGRTQDDRESAGVM